MNNDKLSYDIRKEVLNYVSTDDLPSVEKGLVINELDLLKEIRALDPTFSLSSVLRQIKDKNKQIERLKDTIQWKIRKLCKTSAFFADDGACNYEVRVEIYLNDENENERAEIEKTFKEYLSDDTFKSNYTIVLCIPTSDPEQFIKDLEMVDNLFPPVPNLFRNSYHSKAQ